jgi:alcohol dehydrogenase class IV
MAVFEFATAGRVRFGAGAASEAPAIVAGFGRRPLVVTGSDPARAEWLVEALQARGCDCTLLCVAGEPELAFAAGGADLARRNGHDVVAAIGGGSAIDAGKAIAALATNGGDPLQYLEVVGQGLPLTSPPLPFVAIPTTAGTGSEVTRNAVLLVPAARMKVSLRSPQMLPRAAIVDPELTYGLPAATTASTGLDALTQLIEPFLSIRANAMTDALCREAIPRAARSLGRACEHPQDAAAREDLSIASLFGGLALANAGLGAVHGFAAPIGGMFPAPHGAVCAALLPHVMRGNLGALRARAGGGSAASRLDEVGRLLTGRSDAGARDAIDWLAQTVAALRIPPLSAYGITAAAVPLICEQATQASSMKGNPIVLSMDELSEIVTAAI